MNKESVVDSPLEQEVVQWWSCKEHGLYPEHLYFKSGTRDKTIYVIV